MYKYYFLQHIKRLYVKVYKKNAIEYSLESEQVRVQI